MRTLTWLLTSSLRQCEWLSRTGTSDNVEPRRPIVVDTLHDWPGYMQHVVDWLEGTYALMSDKEKDVCIAEFLTQNSGEQAIFAGIRYHARSEVLHRAGMTLAIHRSSCLNNPYAPVMKVYLQS